MTINGNKLIADDGMTLTNGEAYGKTVWLATGDSAANWREITDEEADQITAEEALEIITGGIT